MPVKYRKNIDDLKKDNQALRGALEAVEEMVFNNDDIDHRFADRIATFIGKVLEETE